MQSTNGECCNRRRENIYTATVRCVGERRIQLRRIRFLGFDHTRRRATSSGCRRRCIDDNGEAGRRENVELAVKEKAERQSVRRSPTDPSTCRVRSTAVEVEQLVCQLRYRKSRT